MGAPGYYLIDLDSEGEPDYDIDGEPVVSGTLVELPINSRLGVEYGTEYSDILLETERGRRWVYPQYNRYRRTMNFRLTLAQLAAFQALDEAVGGQRDPFILVLDTDVSPYEQIFCRKESSMIVKQLENVAHGGMVDYQMVITEEPTGPEITD
ncbi:MAG TPA: hypothetical protein VL329_04630 [Nitrospiraceae bacterium]|jgi:hypothetical protein|nr:hypothetical protein [Nitrospiraceae bacterium]